MAQRRRPRGILRATLLVVGAIAVRPVTAGQHAVELIPSRRGPRRGRLGGGHSRRAARPGGPRLLARPRGRLVRSAGCLVRSVRRPSETGIHFGPSAFGTSAFDFAVDYLQFGGAYGPQVGRVRPYVTVAVGLTRYGASPGEVGSTIGASGSLGGESECRSRIDSRSASRFVATPP